MVVSVIQQTSKNSCFSKGENGEGSTNTLFMLNKAVTHFNRDKFEPNLFEPDIRGYHENALFKALN